MGARGEGTGESPGSDNDARHRGGGTGYTSQERTGSIVVVPTSTTPNPVIAHLGPAPRQHVLEEASEEFQSREGDAAHLLAAVVPIAEGDLAVLDPFDPTVADRDPENVRRVICLRQTVCRRQITRLLTFYVPNRPRYSRTFRPWPAG